ncbi:MAG: HNH endonuclease [Mycolicibacterium mageritense]|nr:MAG: HNH endonuclease [Mycolicibacterium mageritense]
MVVDGGVIPTPLLADLIAAGATVKHLDPPGAEPEPRYRPSAKLAAWVRMRDMTCMFPGCDRPAERCDVDHTEPYPGGPTHPSNTKCLCRIHHLLKTFWAGWHDKQHPDGTVEWTTPSGRTYVKKPGAGLFFPHWDTTTAALPPPGPRIPNDGTTMPRRTRTRAAQRARRKHAERALNGQQDKPPPGL